MFVISGLDPHLDTSPDTQQEMEVIKVEVVDASDLEPLRVKEETAGVHDVTNTYTHTTDARRAGSYYIQSKNSNIMKYICTISKLKC